MENTGDKKHKLVGTISYDNWRAYRNGEPSVGAYEYLLFTDALMIGEVSSGLEPYQFFNLISRQQLGRVRPAIALRIGMHVALEFPDMDRTDQSRYHGGWVTDEIAALASLRCGVRLRPGGETREFNSTEDPKGRPVAYESRPEPSFNIGIHGLVLPDIAGKNSIMPLVGMQTLADLSPEQSIVLIKSARLYQDALWLSESEPNLSWLMLVSSIETAATFWKSIKDSPLERLKESRTVFVEYLESLNIHGLSSRVAKEFDESIGATKKFVDFLIEFLPPPPEKRPAKWGQINWDIEELRKYFRQIYNYRSKALHGGTPFPATMNQPPFRHETWEVAAEKPIAHASYSQGGAWLAKDTPMLLRTFEYIARNALNRWWLKMLEAG
jgi:hypothetical protein